MRECLSSGEGGTEQVATITGERAGITDAGTLFRVREVGGGSDGDQAARPSSRKRLQGAATL